MGTNNFGGNFFFIDKNFKNLNSGVPYFKKDFAYASQNTLFDSLIRLTHLIITLSQCMVFNVFYH